MGWIASMSDLGFLVILFQKRIPKRVKCLVLDTLADVVDQLDNKSLIMDGQQRASERFFGVEEVADVRGGVVLAGVAVTLGHDRLEFFAIFQSAHVDATVRRVGSAISRHTGW